MPLDTIDLGLALDALAPGASRTTTLPGFELTIVRLDPDGRWEHQPATEATLTVLEGLGMIAVDDCHSPYQGKHTAIAAFMAEKQIAPAFTGYQMGWIKP